MIKLRIDDKDFTVPEGAAVIDAAREAGVDIPALCFDPALDHFTSCMVCVVRDSNTGRMIPSCSFPAENGMNIDTCSSEVKEARKNALELLLSEHAGDCRGPCERFCPAGVNIPSMIRRIASGSPRDAVSDIKESLPFPAILGRICPAPCEKGCRRSVHDKPVSIRLLERYVGDSELDTASPHLPACSPKSGKRVAIVGAGPAGLSAAYYLLRYGHACTVFDTHPEPGGMLRHGVSEDLLPRAVLDAEIGQIVELGAQLAMSSRIGAATSVKSLKEKSDAVVFATGNPDDGGVIVAGPAMLDGRIKTDTRTLRTSDSMVFAAGAAAQRMSMAVKAIAHGRSVARSVHQFLSGTEVTGSTAGFDSRLGLLREGEIGEFMREADPSLRHELRSTAGYSADESVGEAARCMHCDCRERKACKLREYAGEYTANQARYGREDRQCYRKVIQHPDIVYEPGKCIKCGICVKIAGEAGEDPGLAFIGRGYDVRVDVPFNEPLSSGLRKVAAKCATSCPTGALALKEEG